MWVAKNSLTGHVYGKEYNSIYDCQKFIDKELSIIEYLSQRVKVLEDHMDSTLQVENYMKTHNCSYMMAVVGCFEEVFKPFIDDLVFSISLNEKEYKVYKKKLKQEDKVSIKSLAYAEYCSNHIIRCYYVEQDRWADGFDF